MTIEQDPGAQPGAGAPESQNGTETPETGEDVQTSDPAVQLAQVTAERDALALTVRRLTVANQTGVPAGLLTGTTEEELQASAAALQAYAKTAAGTPDFGAGDRSTAPPADPDPLRALIAARRRR